MLEYEKWKAIFLDTKSHNYVSNCLVAYIPRVFKNLFIFSIFSSPLSIPFSFFLPFLLLLLLQISSPLIFFLIVIIIKLPPWWQWWSSCNMLCHETATELGKTILSTYFSIYLLSYTSTLLNKAACNTVKSTVISLLPPLTSFHRVLNRCSHATDHCVLHFNSTESFLYGHW